MKFIVAALSLLVLVVVSGCAKKQVQTTTAEPTAAEQQQQRTEAELEAQRQRALEEQRLREEALREEQRASQEVKQAVSEIEENKIYFEFDSFELKPEARTVLQRKAEYLKEFPELKITIEGHADERGTDEYNLALGQRRAQAAYEFLVLLGVDGDRIRTISFGEERPAVTGSNEEAWAKNRRAEFRITS
ncbi:MAG: peptidoglycan-associated lipoprotein Pal [Desulfovibrionales bacterium]